jgi:hypothetical protein
MFTCERVGMPPTRSDSIHAASIVCLLYSEQHGLADPSILKGKGKTSSRSFRLYKLHSGRVSRGEFNRSVQHDML